MYPTYDAAAIFPELTSAQIQEREYKDSKEAKINNLQMHLPPGFCLAELFDRQPQYTPLLADQSLIAGLINNEKIAFIICTFNNREISLFELTFVHFGHMKN